MTDRRVARMRRMASKVAVSLCALERELVNSNVLMGPETLAIAAQTATLRLMLQGVGKKFAEPDPLLPAVRYGGKE